MNRNHYNLNTTLQRVYYNLQWNLYNETGKVLLKPHKFHHLSHMVFTKIMFFLSVMSDHCLERPQNLVVDLYRFHCKYSHLLP